MVDIVTHAGIGLVLAAPFLERHPELAIGLAIGSVLPDLDAVSRLAGKRAFLAAHQTWTHALPVIVLLTACSWLIGLNSGISGAGLGGGIGIGMFIHCLLDLTNTYGIALWLPMDRQRRCLEWMFFIDLGTILLTIGALIWIAALTTTGQTIDWLPTACWSIAMLFWIMARGWLHSRASRNAPPGTVALIPSAWVPWQMYGTARMDGSALQFTLNALTGQLRDRIEVPIYDDQVEEILTRIPEVRIMRTLSPCYHAIRVDRSGASTSILCQDLRIRNFTSHFGACDIIAVDGIPQQVKFNV